MQPVHPQLVYSKPITMASKTSDIHLKVQLDKENIPTKIHWLAGDGPNGSKEAEAKAFLLSIFDKEHKDTLKIDLWTKDMQVNEMDRFFFQTLRALSDTYFKATQNKELAVDMQRFVQYFGEQTEILKKE